MCTYSNMLLIEKLINYKESNSFTINDIASGNRVSYQTAHSTVKEAMLTGYVSRICSKHLPFQHKVTSKGLKAINAHLIKVYNRQLSIKTESFEQLRSMALGVSKEMKELQIKLEKLNTIEG